MSATLEKVFGYQGNPMNLPVPSVDASVPYYESMLGFRLVSRSEAPHKSAVLARDNVTIGIAENGGKPEDDGCAFHVNGLEALLAEYQGRRPPKAPSDIGTEFRDGSPWNVFYVVAPDGLCFWFGERQGPDI